MYSRTESTLHYLIELGESESTTVIKQEGDIFDGIGKERQRERERGRERERERETERKRERKRRREIKGHIDIDGYR